MRLKILLINSHVVDNASPMVAGPWLKMLLIFSHAEDKIPVIHGVSLPKAPFITFSAIAHRVSIDNFWTAPADFMMLERNSKKVLKAPLKSPVKAFLNTRRLKTIPSTNPAHSAKNSLNIGPPSLDIPLRSSIMDFIDG